MAIRIPILDQQTELVPVSLIETESSKPEERPRLAALIVGVGIIGLSVWMSFNAIVVVPLDDMRNWKIVVPSQPISSAKLKRQSQIGCCRLQTLGTDRAPSQSRTAEIFQVLSGLRFTITFRVRDFGT